MATPSAPSFEHLLDILNGDVPAPHTKFVSFKGNLNAQQIDQLAGALQGSWIQGGIRLKGMCVERLGVPAALLILLAGLAPT